MKPTRPLRTSILFSAAILAAAPSSFAAPAYARFPAIRADTVVFTSEGDLWKVAASGGQAQRLTTHPATEMNAALSFDGKWVAFSASYEGTIEAYVMPVTGGVPKRLSFENGNVAVLGWTAQGKVLVSHQNATGPALRRIVAAIDPQTLARTVYPVADANEAVLDDQGKTLYFTRYGSHINGDNAKRYRGGALAQLWRYRLDAGAREEALQLFPKETANLRRPMWWKDRVYYLNDSNGSFNLWSMNADGSDARAITTHTAWDVRNPALGDGRIVYQLGADLHVLDLASGSDRALAIDLLSDFDQMRLSAIRTPLDQLTNVQLANKEERVIATARGHLTVAGTGVQRRIDVAIPPGSRARNAVFSHDDKALYAIVDSTGENEIWKFPIGANSDGKPEVLTRNGDAHRWNIFPSPDGKWIAHNDKRGRLLLLDLATKTETVIDSAGKLGVTKHSSVTWSPDSKTIAIVRPDSNYQREQIGLISVADKKLEFVTSDKYESISPAFSGDGKWLYFISSRNFTLGNRSPWGDRNMGPVFDKRAGVYALALQPGNRFPFKPDDELSSRADKAETEAKKEELKDEKKPERKDPAKVEAKPEVKPEVKPQTKGLPAIVFNGLAQRLYQVPLAAGNYQGLSTDDKRLYFMEDNSAEGSEGKATLKTLAIAKTSPQPETFVAGIREYELSQDRKRVFYRVFRDNGGAGEFMIVDAGPKLPADVSKARVAIEDWTFTANPREEWKQMFNDAWRMHRDFLYDDKMRGVDWKNMRDKYAGLVDRVSDRSELNDVLSLMISEVGSMHSQVRPGDVRRAAPTGQPAALGAVLARADGGMRIEHIYKSEPEQPGERSPLAQPDLDIGEGDIITSVNGASVADARDISDLLLNQAGKQVILRIKRGAGAPKAVVIQPLSVARNDALRYRDWEQERADRVTAASKGKIGYLHLQAMGQKDIAAFARDFYSNVEREGLIIDVRRNRGGNIDSWIIEKLLRKAWAFWTVNNQVSTNMQQTFRGHLVVLVDEMTYSDGETFAAGVKALKLGPLVGKRTSGAGVWLSDVNPLSDNGMIRVAETSQFGLDGNWLIEGVGVAPDIEVDNLPAATFAGRDQQLEVALQLLETRLKEQPVKPLTPQAVPGLGR